MQGILKDLRWLSTVTLLAVLVAAVTLIGGADHSFAATFNPTGEACLDNETTPAKCDGDSAPGAISGITSSFNLPKGDANFSAVISFTPPGWFVANGNDIPDGALVGKLTAGATLGLIGGACNGALSPSFSMMDATINPSSQVTFDDGFKDADSDGLADAVTKYPDFLARIFPGQTLRARLYGQAVVGGVNVSLNFLIFNPGDPIKDITPDPKLGYPSVTILQNIGDPDIKPAASAITDFCSPLTSSTVTYGTTQDNPKTAANEGGKVYRKNPTTAGTYNFVAYASSQRDADGDGLENSLDTCPFNPDTWDPRVGSFATVQPGDSDGDRIPDTCDTSPNDPYPALDVDKDSYLNTGDNCPQVANGINTAGQIIGADNQKDSDSDGIGDDCDILGAGGIGKGPNVADGEVLKLCGVNPIQVGGGGAADTKVKDRIPCGAGVAAEPSDVNATPTPTLAPGATPRPTTAGGGVPGVAGAPGGGIGTLAPVAASVPAWAAFVTAAGGIGLLIGIGALAQRRLAARRTRD